MPKFRITWKRAAQQPQLGRTWQNSLDRLATANGTFHQLAPSLFLVALLVQCTSGRGSLAGFYMKAHFIADIGDNRHFYCLE